MEYPDLIASHQDVISRVETLENSKQAAPESPSSQGDNLTFPLAPVLAQTIQKLFPQRRFKLNDAATINVDATQSNHFYVTLGGNRTLANPTGAKPGQKIIFEFIQDGTGSRVLTLGSKFALGTSIPTVTLTTTGAQRDFMGVIYSDVDDKFYVVALSQGY